MGVFTLLEFAAFATALVEEVEHAKEHALETAAKIIQKEAKRVIGTYEYGWPQLADVTQQERVRLGYSANEPLLRDGDLRNSITVEIIERGKEASIGSDLEYAIYQELGTATIPPRSFLAQAAIHKEKELAHELGVYVVKTIVDGRAPADELIEH